MTFLNPRQALAGQVTSLMRSGNFGVREKLEVCDVVTDRLLAFRTIPKLSEEAFWDAWAAVFQLGTFTAEEFADRYGFSAEEVQGWSERSTTLDINERRDIISRALDIAEERLGS